MIGERPACFDCLWFKADDHSGLKCKAFPKGIPEDILMGEPHNEIRPDQEGNFIYVGPDPKKD